MPHPKVLSTKRLWTEQIFTFLRSSSFQAFEPVQCSKIWTRSILVVYLAFCRIKQIYTVVLVHTMSLHCKLKKIIKTKPGHFCGLSVYFFL